MGPQGLSAGFKRQQRAHYVLRPGFLDAQQLFQLHRCIPQDSPTESMRCIEAGIRAGEFTLAHVYERGERVGWTVYQVVENDNGREFLSIASYGRSRSDLSRAVMPLLEGMARKLGCQTIRLHTMRTGLVEKLIEQGWFVSEIVMRKELDA